MAGSNEPNRGVRVRTALATIGWMSLEDFIDALMVRLVGFATLFISLTGNY